MTETLFSGLMFFIGLVSITCLVSTLRQMRRDEERGEWLILAALFLVLALASFGSGATSLHLLLAETPEPVIQPVTPEPVPEVEYLQAGLF